MCAVCASLIPIRRKAYFFQFFQLFHHAHTHVPTPARTHARPDARRRPRPFYVGIFERLTFPTIHFFTKKDIYNKGTIQETPQKLRANIVLNNKEDPMHETTNTCSCDCGVRENGAEHCACQRLRVLCDEVVKQRVVPWTWSLLCVPMK